jgi:3-phosphoshikimate 1-carboxyvinyltransferase
VNVRFAPAERLRGSLAPPADKSISHRAAIIGAMASEPVQITNYLRAADTDSTLAAVAELGAIVEPGDGGVLIRGCGLRNAQPPADPIDVGNAGTLMRLLPGWLAFQADASFTLDGDDSIRRRPVDRIAEPLARMGARIQARDGRYAPFTVHGQALHGVRYELPVASAQVKSCVLLAGLGTDGTTVIEPVASRDHTERMLLSAGASLTRAGDTGTGYAIEVGRADELELEPVTVPGDMSRSSAALVWCCRGWGSTGPGPAFCGSSSGWAGSWSETASPPARCPPRSRCATWTSATAPSRPPR